MNIGLMLSSLTVACIIPFEVFLFSYAILGPLHYLTEISWLKDRHFFTPKKADWLPLVILSFLVLLGASNVVGPTVTGFLNKIGIGGVLKNYNYDMTFLAFGIAMVFILSQSSWLRTYAVVGLFLAMLVFHVREPGLVAKFDSLYYKVFAVYLPTLIHVYLFTGAFILFGALKSRKTSGYLCLIVFILCTIACFIIPLRSSYQVSEWGFTNYDTTFKGLSLFLIYDFTSYSLNDLRSINLFENSTSIVFARFIAFAYTYHYLNWFSKTSVIQWHKIPLTRLIVIIAAWILSIVLYVSDYTLGFRWLFLLSFTHVLLEFPLNHQSFIGIGKEIRMIVAGKTNDIRGHKI